MSRKIVYFLIIVAALFLFFYWMETAAAYTDTNAVPPNDNTSGPLNIGTASQKKDGDLELKNLKIDDSIELGGVRRNGWLGIDWGTACNWEGLKCSCASDDASVGYTRLMLGTTCAGGKVTNVQILSLDFSSKEKHCWASAPGVCTAGLYSYIGPSPSGDSSIVSSIKSGLTVIANVTVRTINTIMNTAKKIWKKWF